MLFRKILPLFSKVFSPWRMDSLSLVGLAVDDSRARPPPGVVSFWRIITHSLITVEDEGITSGATRQVTLANSTKPEWKYFVSSFVYGILILLLSFHEFLLLDEEEKSLQGNWKMLWNGE